MEMRIDGKKSKGNMWSLIYSLSIKFLFIFVPVMKEIFDITFLGGKIDENEIQFVVKVVVVSKIWMRIKKQ